ncbi:MAG: P-loop NTPase [Candidatus Schekmanbacteria bacterium]|nr:P-loop NTPase [Candidatus Schekmanbacteria bacterium]
MTYKHMDEAWLSAVACLRTWLAGNAGVARVVLAADLFGRLRVILWVSGEASEGAGSGLAKLLQDAAGRWWSGDLWVVGGEEEPLHALAWRDATPDQDLPERLRLLERHRNRGAWFVDSSEPLWRTRGQDNPEGCPIIVFYSFKGGVGRSTALAAFAIKRARRGERVVVMDFDLDAPGIGVLLAADEQGRTAQWGVVDFLLEREAPGPLSDYYHPCRRPEVVGSGELLVFPAGRLDSAYAGKLARVDLEPPRSPGETSALHLSLKSIRDDLEPDWILLDARTGLSEPAGTLLSGLAHLHVLFGSQSEQSWLGLRVIIERLGSRAVAQDRLQSDCVLVQAMVPADIEAAKQATSSFETRSRDEFSDHFYADSPADDDRFWDLRDLDTEDAPHVPLPLSYELKLAHFRDVADVADLLADSTEYDRLAERIAGRFVEASNE